MKDFNKNNLRIEVIEDDSRYTITWLGSSDAPKPGDDLNPYFNEIINLMSNKSLILDFSKLQYMNSSTVPPIVTLIGLLNAKQINTKIYYLKDSNWQKTSFKALEGIVKSIKTIEVVGK